MKQQEPIIVYGREPGPFRLRDMVAVLFRQKRVLALSFLGTLIGAGVALMLLPAEYEAQMKILVKRERTDPVVTPEPGGAPRAVRTMSEQDVNSAVDLVKSRDLLEKVAVTAGLVGSPEDATAQEDGAATQRELTAKAVAKLERDLRVDPPSRSNLIRVRYQSEDPQLAARVLNQLGTLYLDKYVEVHRASGTLEFYESETEKYREELAALQQQLTDFNRNEGVISAEAQKSAALQRLAEFDAQWQQTQAAAADTQQRIRMLEQQAATMPARITTQVRTSSRVLADLRSTLYTLQLKRSELLTKFTPTYRAVRDVDEQIEQTRNAILEAEKTPLTEETTDQDPAREWIRAELARARTEAAGLQARSRAIRKSIQEYQAELQHLDGKSVEQSELLRRVKQAEESYLAALGRQEAARAGEALDREGIANVAIAEAAAIPYFPTSSRSGKLLLALALALLVAVGLAFAFDFLDPSFRTPDEVQALLQLPVLASVPKRLELLPPASVSADEREVA